MVTYNPDWTILKEAIASFLDQNSFNELRVWDNSPTNQLETLLTQDFPTRVTYRHSPQNIGFGAGHNRNFIDCSSDYFCLLNPDVQFTPTSLDQLVAFAEERPSVGLLSCHILNPDGSPQVVHKLMPAFREYVFLILKRLLRLSESKATSHQDIYTTSERYLPILSGCFMLFKTEHFRELKGFDERFFLYFEDYDISLRSFLMGKSAIVNDISVTHLWQRGSHKNFRLFLIHLSSGIKFYGKWGFTKSFPNKINKIATGKNT